MNKLSLQLLLIVSLSIVGCGGGGVNSSAGTGTETSTENLRSKIAPNAVSNLDCTHSVPVIGVTIESGSEGDITVDCESSNYKLINGTTSLTIVGGKVVSSGYNECDSGNELIITTFDFDKKLETINEERTTGWTRQCELGFTNVLPTTLTVDDSIKKFSEIIFGSVDSDRFNLEFTSTSAGCTNIPTSSDLVSGNCKGITKTDMYLRDNTGKVHRTTHIHSGL